MPKQTKPKTARPPKKNTPPPVMPILPPAEKQLFLPKPTRHVWAFVTVAVMAIAVVASYAIHPWFSISTGATRVIMTIVMIVFLLGLIGLFVALARLFIDIWRSHTDALERDKHMIVVLLVLLLSIVIFSSTVYLFIL
jgi:hypothetical protein